MNTSKVSLERIALRCVDETRKYALQTAYVTEYCMELMRRALLRRIPDAFTRLYEIYQPLVRSWVYRHHQFEQSGEDADFFVNAALTQFYFAVSGKKFERFDTLAQLLQYLKRCVYTSIAMHVRSRNIQLADTPVAADDFASAEYPDWDRRMGAELLWSRVRALLPEEDDQLLARLSFVEGMKPAEILREQSQRWKDTRDISVALQRIRRRLRSDPLIQEWVRDYAEALETQH